MRLVYVPGNHDEVLRGYPGMHFGGVEVIKEAIYVAAEGRRLLVIHGDEFDGVVTYARWLALLGDWAYVTLIDANTWFNFLRRTIGFGHMFMVASLQPRMKYAAPYIG